MEAWICGVHSGRLPRNTMPTHSPLPLPEHVPPIHLHLLQWPPQWPLLYGAFPGILSQNESQLLLQFFPHSLSGPSITITHCILPHSINNHLFHTHCTLLMSKIHDLFFVLFTSTSLQWNMILCQTKMR